MKDESRRREKIKIKKREKKRKIYKRKSSESGNKLYSRRRETSGQGREIKKKNKKRIRTLLQARGDARAPSVNKRRPLTKEHRT